MIRRAALSLAGLLAACNPQPSGEAVTRIDLDRPATPSATPEPSPTPTAVSACAAMTFEDTAFTHCTADPARHRITTVLGNPPHRGFAALAGARPADAPPVAFAVNAGMFDGAGKPIGYYVRDGDRGQTLNRNEGPGNFHMQPNGVFFGTGSAWRVLTAQAFNDQIGDRPDFGTQSGPMLVVDGQLHPEITDDGPSRTIRNGVGVDAAGRAHFVISEEPVSFGKLARLFRDRLKTANALYLDGSVSALWDPAGDRMDERAPIGPMLVIEERATVAGRARAAKLR